MKRPAVLRQLESHVRRRSVGPYRLRPPEVAPLLAYVEHLEANQRPAPVALDQARRISADTLEAVEAMTDARAR